MMIDSTNVKIEFNFQFQKALDLLGDTNKNIFLTGKAGTGKSTLLDYFRRNTEKKLVVLAPTGVASLNVQGQTIHSFFGFKPDITKDKVYGLAKRAKTKKVFDNLDMIIIDEISMVRADLLDYIDLFLRVRLEKHKPFGGIQMVFIGDLYQLPPVVSGNEKKILMNLYKTPFFFSSEVMQDKSFNFELIELDKIYRQKDNRFIEVLNKIRNNSVDDEDLKVINERLDEGYEQDPSEFSIYITTTNASADRINNLQLAKLETKEYVFNGEIQGDFSSRSLPTKEALSLRVGTRIMLLNNDKSGRWVNGTIGKITEIIKDDETLLVELSTGEIVEVTPYTWEMFSYSYDNNSKSIQTEVAGSFRQLPVRLSWAITIHKSQGKTFNDVILDIGTGTFTSGHAYVALSRCTSLEGLILKRPLKKKHIWLDWAVNDFLTQHQYNLAREELTVDDIKTILESAIADERKIEIVYLKTDNTKSTRVLSPQYIGELRYGKHFFTGLEAYCFKRKAMRNFKLDRILEIRYVGE